MRDRGSAISSASSTSTLEEMPSNVGAFVGSNFFSFCSTLSLVMSMSISLMLSSPLNLVSGSSYCLCAFMSEMLSSFKLKSQLDIIFSTKMFLGHPWKNHYRFEVLKMT